MLFREALDEIVPSPPFLALTLFLLLWRYRPWQTGLLQHMYGGLLSVKYPLLVISYGGVYEAVGLLKGP